MRYGATRDHVESLKVVLADGKEVRVGRDHSIGGQGKLSNLTRRLSAILLDNQNAIEGRNTTALVDSNGYCLHNAMRGNAINLLDLFVGAEGTLGAVTEVTIKTQPIPQHVGVALLFFDRLEKAARAALEIRNQDVAACELMDRRLLSLARDSDVRYDTLLPKAAEAMLLVECEDDDASQLGQRLASLVTLTSRKRKLAFASRTAIDSDDYHLYWRLARRVVSSLYRLTGGECALPMVEDVAVAPDRLPQLIVRAQNVVKKYEVTASYFAHAGHGQLQLRPFLNLDSEEDVAKLHNPGVGPL